MLLLFIAALLFWNTVLLYPIKLFVVVLHELSHGLAAIMVGGSIEEIKINERIGGSCHYIFPQSLMGRLIIASAGYLGSMIWGGLILVIASRTRHDNLLALVIGNGLIILSALYIRSPFGLIFTAGFGLVLIFLAIKASNKITDLAMKFLGMTSCLYAIIDIKDDLIVRSGIGSDADRIATLLGMPWLSVGIGILWCVIAIISFLLFLRIAGSGKDR